MRRLAVLIANRRYVWRLRLRKLLFAIGHFCCFRLSHGHPGGPACPWQIVYETSRLLEQDRTWSASGLCMIGKRNQPARSGWVVGRIAAWSDWVLAAEAKQEAQLMLTTGSTRLAVSRGQQTWYHSTCYIWFPIVQ